MYTTNILNRHFNIYAAIAIVLMTVVLPAQAAMRCGTKLIDIGDSAIKLLEDCGEPAIGDTSNLDYGEWTYNFGPEKFMIKVQIVNGQVDIFQTLGRGYVTEEGGGLPDANDAESD